jgi:hypothetical protein
MLSTIGAKGGVLAKFISSEELAYGSSLMEIGSAWISWSLGAGKVWRFNERFP